MTIVVPLRSENVSVVIYSMTLFVINSGANTNIKEMISVQGIISRERKYYGSDQDGF